MFTLSQPKTLQKSILIYAVLALALGVLLPLLTHQLLPLLGVGVFSNILTTGFIHKLGILFIGGLIYVTYFRFVTQKPLYLVLFSTVFYRFFLFICHSLEAGGKHVPLKTMLVPLLLLPSVFLLFRNLPKLIRRYPYFIYMLLFMALYIGYFMFFNLNFVDPTVANKVSGMSISKGQITDYFYGFGMLVIVGSMFIMAEGDEKKRQLFEMINRFLIVEMIVEATCTIIGYPFGIFTLVVEGFRRAVGFATHPNEYGKMVGVMLIYFIGLYYYHTKKNAPRDLFINVLLPIAIVLNLLGFLLSLSKNSFVGFAAACLIYLVSALFDANLRKRLAMPLIVLGVLLVLAFIGYQAFSGKNLLTLLTDRFSDTRSMEWRGRVWGYLLSHIDSHNILFGHGLTASNMEMYRFQYRADMDSAKQSIYVHNAFIQFIFDMGLCGLLVFGGIISSMVSSLKRFITDGFNPLYLTIIGLSLYFLIGALADECITEMQLNMLYWFVVTMIFSFAGIKAVSPQINDPDETIKGSSYAHQPKLI